MLRPEVLVPSNNPPNLADLKDASIARSLSTTRNTQVQLRSPILNYRHSTFVFVAASLRPWRPMMSRVVHGTCRIDVDKNHTFGIVCYASLSI